MTPFVRQQRARSSRSTSPIGTTTEPTSSPGSPDGSIWREAHTMRPPTRIASTINAATPHGEQPAGAARGRREHHVLLLRDRATLRRRWPRGRRPGGRARRLRRPLLLRVDRTPLRAGRPAAASQGSPAFGRCGSGFDPFGRCESGAAPGTVAGDAARPRRDGRPGPRVLRRGGVGGGCVADLRSSDVGRRAGPSSRRSRQVASRGVVLVRRAGLGGVVAGSAASSVGARPHGGPARPAG